MLLELVDGGILNIENDIDFWSGCETCDYGSRYVNYFDLELSKIKIKIEASEMYEYPLSEGHMMKVILGNVDIIKKMTEQEFANWLKLELGKEVGDLEYEVSDK